MADTIIRRSDGEEIVPQRAVDLGDGSFALAVDIPAGAVVTGPLTDTELRASPVDIAGPLTDTELRAAPVDIESAISEVTIYNVTIAAGGTEYSQSLPATCRHFSVRSRNAEGVYLAMETGKVAGPATPYLTLPAGAVFDSGPVKLSGATVYIAGSAGDVVEIEAWG